jgi:hypothetical protein
MEVEAWSKLRALWYEAILRVLWDQQQGPGRHMRSPDVRSRSGECCFSKLRLEAGTVDIPNVVYPSYLPSETRKVLAAAGGT